LVIAWIPQTQHRPSATAITVWRFDWPINEDYGVCGIPPIELDQDGSRLVAGNLDCRSPGINRTGPTLETSIVEVRKSATSCSLEPGSPLPVLQPRSGLL
jgi:hypothetical protein